MDAAKKDFIATAVLWASALLILGILGWFLVYILGKGIGYLDFSFITGRPSLIRAGGGVGPFLFNSFYLLLLSLIMSVPLGMAAGVWLSEYARRGHLSDSIRVAVECLASIPSIVLGLFGMIVFVNWMGLGLTILGGSLSLAILNLPVLVRVTEESLRSIPLSYREASLSLGATKYQTLIKVLLPASLPTLVTGIILASGRILGETAILIFTAGTGVSRHEFDVSPFAPGGTLAVHLWATQANPILPDWERIANGSAALLILVVLVFNSLVAIPSRILYRKAAGQAARIGADR